MYTELPQLFSPYIVDLGIIKIHWYGAMYVLAFLTAILLIRYRLKHEKRWSFSVTQVYDALLWTIGGLLIGGRLGYVLFYNLEYYLMHPIQIISPFHNGVLVGIAGMSFHGGLIGAIIGTWWFCKKKNLSLSQFADLIIPTIPLGYTFGRIGNFINKELYGRATDSVIGMNFGDGIRRHPSQLYEAFFEGIVLFIILWSIRNKQWAQGKLLGLYIIGYGIARFSIEFFREPDEQLGFIAAWLTMGQLLSLAMIIAGILFILWPLRKN